MYEGKYVLVRGDRSGVFAGTLKTKDGGSSPGGIMLTSTVMR